MNKKLSLEEFRNIKNKFNDLNFDIQKDLLSYDLSNIPFEEWKGINIPYISLDFSNTHANIDFEIFDVDNYFFIINFKGCNIKNLYKLEGKISSFEFDRDIVKNVSSPLLSSEFKEDFISKYNNESLSIEDLIDLSKEQILLLKEKNVIRHFKDQKIREIIKIFGLDKIIELYKYNKEDYEFVKDVVDLSNRYPYHFDSKVRLILLDKIVKNKNIEITEIKNICNSYLKEMILNSNEGSMLPGRFPKAFVNENKDIFLIDSKASEDLKFKYYNRKLSLDDIIKNINLFENIPIENFIDIEDNIDNYIVKDIAHALGKGNLIGVLKKHPDVIKYIIDSVFAHDFVDLLKKNDFDLEKKFTLAVKQFYLEHNPPYVPSYWISSMNFKIMERINTVEDLMNYKDETLLLHEPQRDVINILGIDNIKKLEEETKIFSKDEKLKIFSAICDYFYTHTSDGKQKNYDGYYDSNYDEYYKLYDRYHLSFKNGQLPYKEFRDEFSKLLNIMRNKSILKKHSASYDEIEGNFRKDYPEIFIDHNVPEELKEKFYEGKLSLDTLHKYQYYLKYFIDKDLSFLIKADIKLDAAFLHSTYGYQSSYETIDFIKEYTKRYGNEKLLNLISKYGSLLNDITVNSLNLEIEDEQQIEESIRRAVYEKIINLDAYYEDLQDVPEFVDEHPELFVDFKQIQDIPSKELKRLKYNYYNGSLMFDDIKNYPQLVDILKSKNLSKCFSRSIRFNHDLYLLDAYGPGLFLKLCEKYGSFMTNIVSKLSEINVKFNSINFIRCNEFDEKIETIYFDEIDKIMEEVISKECKLGNISYTKEDAPEFLKEQHPELFLSVDAPSVLKWYFYNDTYSMTFRALSENYDAWKPFLEGKSISTSLLRNPNIHEDVLNYINVFGEDVAIKLGINKAETVTAMLTGYKTDIMKKWYDKTGGKFIPDHVVMENIDIEEADKFLSSASNWSSLMKITNFAQNSDARDAMLKLAYSFGAFDNDQRGFKKLQDLLTSIPKKIDFDNYSVISRINNELDKISKRREFFKVHREVYKKESGIVSYKEISKITNDEDKDKSYNEMIEYIKASDLIDSSESLDIFTNETLMNLFDALREEVPNIDFSKKIFFQLYRFNKEDGSHTLTINPQSCPKTTKVIRKILEKFVTLNILTPTKAHQLFGGFKLEYNPEFREFLLDNLNVILNNGEYATYISSIQKQFKDIKRANSNRKLTLDLAVSYVQANKYENVEIGNEGVAEISAIAGYTQEDFNILQKIYNYGKQRVFSSIPRIEEYEEDYSYEMLRLDDPLAMVVGTLSNCCQEIGNVAEMCMEHSMVDKNGRVFVVRDKNGNIVAQSWVWRNKNVLCFDNIEIPDKAFKRFENNKSKLDRKDFTDKIYEIYKKAAHLLIEQDEKEYKKLVDEGKITQEQYEGLKLNKVTVGLGYNDIAGSLKRNAKYDDDISRPLSFDAPVQLNRGLYTSDSNTQYILEEIDENKTYAGGTLSVHNDTYIEYDNSNFKEINLLALGKLEIQTKGYCDNLDIEINEYNESKIVTEIANNYDLNPNKTRIIMHPNFAIIYEMDEDKVKIADLFYNTEIKNKQKINIENVVIMQIRLALEQIGKDKKIDISELDNNQKEIYNKAMNLEEKLDEAKGIKK